MIWLNLRKKVNKIQNLKLNVMCTGGCGGSGGKGFTPRTPTSRPYTPPPKPKMLNRAASSSSNGSRASSFGTPRVKFSGRK